MFHARRPTQGVAEASRRAGENAAGVSHSTSARGRPNRSRAARYPRLERVFHVFDTASSPDMSEAPKESYARGIVTSET